MKKSAELILHWIILISTFLAVGVYFVADVSGHGDNGVLCFKYFTTDSNVLALLSSLLCILFHRKGDRPHSVAAFQFVSTVTVTVTFLMVIFLMAPRMAIFKGVDAALVYFKGNGCILHVTTPVLSVAALLLSRKTQPFSICFWSVVPVFAYSVFYLITTIFLGIWDDWYGFSFGGHTNVIPLSMLGMYALTFLIALTEKKALDKAASRQSDSNSFPVAK